MTRSHTHWVCIALALAVLSLLASAALAQSGREYTLLRWTVDGGGVAFRENGGYMLNSTVGQPDAAVWTGDEYTLAGGFWGGAGAKQHRVYLPLLLRSFCNRTGQWECEPNDSSAQAHGPIASETTYYGTMPADDLNDYFTFDLPSAGSVDLWLTQIPSGCDFDLVLRDSALTVVGYSANYGAADEHVVAGSLSPGRYYVQVYHFSAAGSTTPYHLQVVYP